MEAQTAEVSTMSATERKLALLESRVDLLRTALLSLNSNNEALITLVARLVHDYYQANGSNVSIVDDDILTAMWENKENQTYWLNWAKLFVAAQQLVFQEFLDLDDVSQQINPEVPLETGLN